MKQSVGLIVTNAAQGRDVFPRNLRVSLDILQHHLFLLNGIKPSLTHVIRRLAQLLVEFRAQGRKDTPSRRRKPWPFRLRSQPGAPPTECCLRQIQFSPRLVAGSATCPNQLDPISLDLPRQRPTLSLGYAPLTWRTIAPSEGSTKSAIKLAGIKISRQFLQAQLALTSVPPSTPSSCISFKIRS